MVIPTHFLSKSKNIHLDFFIIAVFRLLRNSILLGSLLIFLDKKAPPPA